MLTSRIAIAAACLLMLGALSACQPAARQPQAEPLNAVRGPGPDNPVLAFVTSAQAGQSGMVTDPQSGPLQVTFIEEYPAASGEICRRYSVETAQGESKVGAACYNGVAWELAPLLP
jgi:hypothetical protein